MTLEESLSRCKPYEANSKKAKELNRSVMRFLAKDMLPFYAVEKPGFKQLLHHLDP